MTILPQNVAVMIKLVADNTIPFLKGIPEDFAEVTYLHASDFTPESIKQADALIVRSINKCTRNLLAGSNVKLITTATIGFDHIDIRYCEEAGIKWNNAPGCNAVSVSQYVLSSLLTLAARKGEALKGKTIGIIGVGHVGREVEKLSRAMGLRILLNDPPQAEKEGGDAFVSLDRIAKEADIITVHTPLEKEGKYPTYHLIDKPFLSQLQKKPWFINAARGGIHQTEALIQAKQNGLISEMILDCWENEPHIDLHLLDMASIATPHIAGFSADGKANATRACLKNIGDFFHIDRVRTEDVLPPPPTDPIINLSGCQSDVISQAVFTSFSPLHIDQCLRNEPQRFESFRAGYDHPREFSAYTVTNAPEEEKPVLRQLGFQVI